MSAGTLTLPAILEGVPMGAHTEYGKRLICWTLPEPGELYRNRYEIAWIDVTEREPWKGEPLWLSATRRHPGASGRVPFTDLGRDALHADIVPQIARHGFGDLWLALHRTKGSGAAEEAARAHRVASWWDQKAALDDMHQLGLVEFVPIDQREHPRGLRKQIAEGNRGTTSTDVGARAFVDGVSVGWMTTRGELIPNDGILR